MRGYYKLARVACGIGHYANVEIELVESDSEAPVDHSTLTGIQSFWIPAARRGVADAIALVGVEQFKLGSIGRLEGTLADTNDDGVWLAAFLATMDALQMTHRVQSFSFRKPHWVVELEDGSHARSLGEIKPVVITRELLEIHDKYNQDFGLLDERWADEEDRQRVTGEQCGMLGEYVDKLHQIKLEGFSEEMQERALERIRDIEEVTDPEVVLILRNRILGTSGSPPERS